VVTNSQVRIVLQSMKSKIAARLKDILAAGVPELKYISFDRVRLRYGDFTDYELPAVQIYDVGETAQHENVRKRVTWILYLELIMKSSMDGEVNQADLWNMAYLIERKLWADPTLGGGLPGFLHIKYSGNVTDLHLLPPFYSARIEFEAHYYEDLVREC